MSVLEYLKCDGSGKPSLRGPHGFDNCPICGKRVEVGLIGLMPHEPVKRYFCNGPTNKRDVERFSRLTPEDKRWASDRAERLYDGSRTVARCWITAMNEVYDPEIVGNA